MRLTLLGLLIMLTACSGSPHPKPRAPIHAKGFDSSYYGVVRPVDDPDIVVATVREVSDGPATNGNPPHVLLHIHEVLRGNLRPGSMVRAVWLGTSDGVDWVGGNAQAITDAWRKKPLSKPTAGSKFLLAGRMREGSGAFEFDINGSGKLPFTDQNRRDVIDQLAASDARLAKEAANKNAARAAP